jgi:RecQ family ATP-dependent DNA helicase
MEQLLLLRLLKKHRGQSGIIYTATRRSTQQLARVLTDRYQLQSTIASYHGGMESSERTKIQQKFISNEIQIIIATNAFGMGIDKPNIRFVIHYHYPASLEAYYQEVGRAGRDGLPADCYTFHEPNVQKIHLELIKKQNQESQNQKIHQLMQTEQFFDRQTCRMQALQAYFAEESPPMCGSCDNCKQKNKDESWWLWFLEDEAEKNRLKKLCKLRVQICSQSEQPLVKFFTNQQLCFVALMNPQIIEDFLKIPGIGRGWVQEWQAKIPQIRQLMIQCTP